MKGADLVPVACLLACLFNYVPLLFYHPLSFSSSSLFSLISELSLRYGGNGKREWSKKKKKEKGRALRYSTGDCGNPLIKACILIHPKACLMVYYELLCDH